MSKSFLPHLCQFHDSQTKRFGSSLACAASVLSASIDEKMRVVITSSGKMEGNYGEDKREADDNHLGNVHTITVTATQTNSSVAQISATC